MNHSRIAMLPASALLAAALSLSPLNAQSANTAKNGAATVRANATGGPALPIYLTGTVVLDDGSPAPQSVAIERVCDGSTHKMGFVDASGSFAIYLDDDSAAFQDASDDLSGGSVPKSLSDNHPDGGASYQDRLLQSCELRAKLAGYSSTHVLLSGRKAMESPDLGAILLHRISPAEADLVSATTLMAPKAARRDYEKAVNLEKKGDTSGAQSSLQKAVEAYPNYAEAWTALGRLQAASEHAAAARASFERAVAADVKFTGAYMGLALLAYQAHQWTELAAASSRVSTLDPIHYPQAYLLNSVALVNLSRLEEAEKAIGRAQLVDTQHRFPQIAYFYGVISAERRHYAVAADEMRAYLALAPKSSDAAAAAAHLQQYERALLPEQSSK